MFGQKYIIAGFIDNMQIKRDHRKTQDVITTVVVWNLILIL